MNRKFKIELEVIDGEGPEMNPTEAASAFREWLREAMAAELSMTVVRSEVACA